MHQILVIDDNPEISRALKVLFKIHGIATLSAETPEAGLALVASDSVDLVIQDMNFSEDTTSGKEGEELFRELRAHDPDLPVILFTAWANLEMAVELVKQGAADYISKPWDDQKLITTVSNLLELRDLQQQQRRWSRDRTQRQQSLARRFDLCGAVYASERMHEALTLATRVADADVPVLITGDNGTGKDVIARIIQKNSKRQAQPFVTVNVGALPEDLMEAELFGAEAGAFTGADKRRIGRFEAADGGTLFLDEIGNLSAPGQMKLLRILQTGEYERLGSSETRRVDVRVITATNTNLKEAMEKREFRDDLYYRINVIEIPLASLAERQDDILPLARHFLSGDRHLTPAAQRALLKYPWPGNVRELENLIKRAELLSTEKRISPSDLGLTEQETATGREGEDELSRAAIEGVLERVDGNISQAALELGLSRQALYRRIANFNIKL